MIYKIEHEGWEIGMEIYCSINLTDREKEQLTAILKCEEVNLGRELINYGNAALEEYIRLLLGQKVFTRGSDFREYRLFLLINHVFISRIPDEQEICDRFQCTGSQARALVRSVMSKYQYDLSEALNSSLSQVLENSTKSETTDDYLMIVGNKYIVEALNQVLIQIDGTLPPIVKDHSTVSQYLISASSRESLLEELSD